MKRPAILALLLALAACGGPTPPRDLDNACAMIRERPDMYRAMTASAETWGIPVNVQMAVMYQESRFVHDARTPYRFALGVIPLGRQSSAFGYSQALDATWETYQRETGNRSARRNNIRDAADFMGWYMADTVERNGVAPDNARNQYLAYHEGHAGYARGSYRRKSWLVRVANRVDARADMYGQQLEGCVGS